MPTVPARKTNILNFDHKHYVPILKTKAGEKWAIGHLDGALIPHLTPLFEIHSHKDRDNSPHAESVCDDLSSTWNTSFPFFLDTIWLHEQNGDATLIESVFNYSRSIGLLAIPVVRLTYDQATLNMIVDIHSQDGRGFLLRLPSDQVGSTHMVDALLNYVGVPTDEVHLMLDYRHHPMQLRGDVPSIPRLADWRTFTAASGTFPRSIASQPIHSWQQVSRHDWGTWETDVISGSLSRLPAFSDYTIRDPGPPAAGGEPSVNVRYTKEDYWLTRIDRKLKDGYASDYQTLCADLITRSEYDGMTYCDGDQIIYEIGNNAHTSGGAQQWVQWAMNHHLTFAVNQIQGHPSL